MAKSIELQYLEMLSEILSNGYDTGNRTDIQTRVIPSYSYYTELQEGEDGFIHNFPLHTTKNVFLRGVFEELKWKLSGSTNIKDLLDKNIHIWTDNAFIPYLKQTGRIDRINLYADESKGKRSDEYLEQRAEFEQRILDGSHYLGELGPTYGHHMRRFGEITCPNCNSIIEGIDQLNDCIKKIKTRPEDRRIIMSLWNPHDNLNTILPPCPCFYQFIASETGYLHLNVYQRSCDTFLGVPFNDAQDALLLIMMAKITGRKPKRFTHFFADTHIYHNHFDYVKEQLTREPKTPPSIRVNGDPKDIADINWQDIELFGYDPHPGFKNCPVAV